MGEGCAYPLKALMAERRSEVDRHGSDEMLIATLTLVLISCKGTGESARLHY